MWQSTKIFHTFILTTKNKHTISQILQKNNMKYKIITTLVVYEMSDELEIVKSSISFIVLFCATEKKHKLKYKQIFIVKLIIIYKGNVYA